MKIPQQAEPVASARYSVRLPISEKVGLGDVIKKITGAFGVKPCGGCNKRAEALNDYLSFQPRRR